MAKTFNLLGKDDEKEEKVEGAEDLEKDEKVREAEGKVRVSLKEDEGDEPPKRGRNQQGKDTRWSEMKEKTRAAEDRAARLEQERDDSNRRLAEAMERQNDLHAQTLGHLQRQNQPPVRDELEEQRKGLMDEAKKLNKEYQSALVQSGGRMSPEVLESFEDRKMQLEERARDNSAARMLRQAMPQRDPRAEAGQAIERQMELRYPHVFAAGEQAKAYSQQTYNRMVLRGAPRGWDTLDKAMEETSRDLGIQGGRRQAPSDNIKRRFSAVPRGGAMGRDEPEEVELDADAKAIAMAFTSHQKGKSDKDRIRSFVRTVK